MLFSNYFNNFNGLRGVIDLNGLGGLCGGILLPAGREQRYKRQCGDNSIHGFVPDSEKVVENVLV